MIFVKSSEFRKNLHKYLQLIIRGHRIVLTLHGEPIAEIKLPPENNVITGKTVLDRIKVI